MPEREDLFAYYAGRDEGQRLFRFRHNRLELLRTRELLLRQLPSPPAVVLDVGGGTGVHAAWLAGRGYRGLLAAAELGRVRAESGLSPLGQLVGPGLEEGHDREPAQVGGVVGRHAPDRSTQREAASPAGGGGG